MNSLLKLSFFLFFIFSLSIYAQETHKSIRAVRTSKAPKIDGNPGDNIWNKAEKATGFIMFDPVDGKPEDKQYSTEVKILYDDVAIYVLAVMKDPNPEKISKEFGLRDQVVEADYFEIIINPFFSKANNYVFGVMASGAQLDGILRTETDYSWNAVWKSAVGFTKDAWVVEMSIPYSALRFQNEENQTWGIDFIRHINHKKETYSWTYIDKKKTGDWVQFLGSLKDLKKLHPPVRLSLYPYASTNFSTFKGETKTDYGFGMDLKYGLSENYTLDATLIPDFSDTPYDNLVLNLGPFEQYYPEQRQFFTEGMSLFNKMNLFYSRRIGDKPGGYNDITLNNNEIVDENPEIVKLINAVKISGRSKNGLGIGFLNAITQPTDAIIRDTITGETREIETEPLANYNVFVMDYNFNRTNSVGLINTNVIRSGEGRDANVIGAYFDINKQKNTLNFAGEMARSFIFSDKFMDDYQGNKFYFSTSKSFGPHKVFANTEVQDKNFDPRDLAYNEHNNYVRYTLGYKYSSLKPSKIYRKNILYAYTKLNYLYQPYQPTLNSFFLTNILISKKLFVYNITLMYAGDEKDFYEPRVPGRFYLVQQHLGSFGSISSDRRKKLSYKIAYSFFRSLGDDQNLWMLGFEPKWRINNRFKFNYSIRYRKRNNYKGYLGRNGNNVYFGNREQKVVTNAFGANYYFTVKSALNLNLYHYWTPIHYNKLYLLENDGNLNLLDDNYTYDINYNYWNFDLVYIWEFAPGSQLSLMYRNRIEDLGNNSDIGFGDNLDLLFKKNKEHRFIMKITYYIDYNTVKNKYF
jgi:hypothetical protein